MHRAICTVNGCERKHCAKGYCQLHYERARRGIPLVPGPKRKPRCSVDECGRYAARNGYCRTHDRRVRLYGDPNTVRCPPGPAWLRDNPAFWRNVKRSHPRACWYWTGKLQHGYGRFKTEDGRWVPAHRYAYELAHGPIPDGHVVDHVCHNADRRCAGGLTCRHRACVNPAHLEATTSIENIRRATGRPSSLRRVDALGIGHAEKTHCRRGHPYDETNTRIYQGRRWCRACDAERARAKRQTAMTEQRDRRSYTRLTDELLGAVAALYRLAVADGHAPRPFLCDALRQFGSPDAMTIAQWIRTARARTDPATGSPFLGAPIGNVAGER